MQLVEEEAGKKMDIMLGGGRAAWQPRDQKDQRWDYDTDEWNCTRWDGRNLIEEWQGNHTGGVYIENRTELMALDMENSDSVLGKQACQCINLIVKTTEEGTLKELNILAPL